MNERGIFSLGLACMALAVALPVSAPEPGEGRKQHRGTITPPPRVERKAKSASLERMLGRRKRRA